MRFFKSRGFPSGVFLEEEIVFVEFMREVAALLEMQSLNLLDLARLSHPTCIKLSVPWRCELKHLNTACVLLAWREKIPCWKRIRWMKHTTHRFALGVALGLITGGCT